jgi:Tol biopolymer transport system component
VDDQPAWSPDGKYLVFPSDRTGDVELFLMRADGSGQTQLTKSPGADWLPRWFVSKAPPTGAKG